MEQFFSLPLATIALASGFVLAVVITGALLAGGRGAPVIRLGVRNLPRRPARAVLIVLGLTLATTTISSAFGTGDTIGSTLHSLVKVTLGTTDEAIVINVPRQSAGDRARSLANGTFGGLRAADLGFFPQNQYDGLRARLGTSDAIAAIAPAIADQVTATVADAGETRSAIGLLATRTPEQAFGRLTSLDGAPLDLDGLGANAVVLNGAAADLFGVTVGQNLTIRPSDGGPLAPGTSPEWTVQVAAISPSNGIGGATPLIIAPLAAYQGVLGRSGQINQILVANGGGDTSVERTATVSEALRGALVERSAAQNLHTFIARPEIQRGLSEYEATLAGRDREKIAELRREALKTELTPRFISLVTDPLVRRQLFALTRQLPSFGDRRNMQNQLNSLALLSVIEVKQEGLDQANEYGNVVTTVFFVLGIFSLGAAILLIHLIFSLLATDRASELATLRSLGMGRRQIAAIFLSEGFVYALCGAALGAVAGIVAIRLTVASLAEALVSFGYQLQPHIEPRSLLIAFLAGLLLTFLAMCAAAWRVSHAQIVAATRGEEQSEGRGGLAIAVGLLLLVAAAAVWWRWHNPVLAYLPRHPLIVPGSLSLLAVGVATLLTGLVRGRGMAKAEWVIAPVQTVAGFMLAAFWLRALATLPTVGGEIRDDALTAAVGGLMLIGASVWTATRALAPTLHALDRGLAPLPRLRLIVRPAAAALGAARGRAALTIMMFGMVVFIMVAALTLIDSLVNAYAGGEPPIAGFDLRGDLPGTVAMVGSGEEIRAALTTSQAIRPEAFAAIGGIASFPVRAVQFGVPSVRWRDATIVAADDGFLAQTTLGFSRRARGYSDDAAIWRALRAGDHLAVLTGTRSSATLDAPTGDGAFAPFTVWTRATDTGAPIKLTIIGIIDPRSDAPLGIWTSRATASAFGTALPSSSSYYFTLAPGTGAADAVAGLKVTFADRGLVVTDLNTTVRIGQSVRALLTQLVQGFMGLGLIAGVAALGIIGIQSVIERRQQLGTLRALGYTRLQTQASLALESAATAVVGVALGTMLGLILARSLIAILTVRAPELRFAPPWGQIGFTLLLALLGTLAALLIAAWQAGRVSPADALRPIG
jgi:putative ABC transport system permease protein